MTTTRTHEYGARRKGITNAVNGAAGTVSGLTYTYDSINRRAKADWPDGCGRRRS